MYRYDAIDRSIVAARVAQFRDQTRRYLAGKLSEDEFRPLRLQNGLYVEKNGPMLRIAIPYGQINAAQLDKLAGITRRYDRGYGHFTTRQNIQLNWVKLPEVPELLAELAEVDMHAIQTSGSVIRNVTTDHYAGVSADEIADPRPYAEILRQWSTLHPEFAFLPRKFKIAVSGSTTDRAAIRVHDVGLQLAQRDGAIGFQVYVGGGLGRTPLIGEEVKSFLPWPHLLTYLEAVLRVYNRYGRRDNLYKARIKILVQALGVREFARQVEEEWQHLKDGPQTLTEAELARVAAHFAPPEYETLPADDLCQLAHLREDKPYGRWVERNVRAHKVPGYASVTLSLKKPGVAPGDATAEQLEAVADLARRYSHGEVRVSHEQNLVLADVPQRELYTVWHRAKAAGLATPTIGLLADLITCPGGDFCELANARSIPVAGDILQRFDDLDYLHDIGELDLNISGCMNGCGHNAVGHIGILGVEKHGEEWYQVSLGGNQGNAAAVGQAIGPAIPAAEVTNVIERLIATYLALRHAGERFIDTVQRLGHTPFRDAAYQAPSHEEDRRVRYA
ncbi:MAG: nitrite/sulfite reductase [Rhodocyclales bacterium]|nr:nitrite/sulfite reductase [Rhodocyclales bacterium]